MNDQDNIDPRDAEIDRLNAALANRKAKIAELMGEAARAEIAGAAAIVPADRNAVLEEAANYNLKDGEKIFYSRLGQSCDGLPFMTDCSIHSVWDIAMVFKASHKRPSHIFLDPFYSSRANKSAAPAAPLPEQTGPSVTAEEIGKIAMSLIGELTSDLADSDDEEEVHLNGTASGIGHLHAELLKLLKSKPSATPSSAPAQQQEPSAVILATLLRAALKAAELGRGSYHQNYDGNTLGHAIEELLESVKTAAPGASTEDKQ